MKGKRNYKTVYATWDLEYLAWEKDEGGGFVRGHERRWL